jgi:HSP20 family protein
MPRRTAYVEELQRIREQVNALIENALVGSGFGGRGERPAGAWAPAVDVLENEAEFVLRAELPGARRDDIDLRIEDQRLVLTGTRGGLGEGSSFLRMERGHGPFRRVVEFDAPVDPDGVVATFERGILAIRAPKRPEPARS